MSALAAGFLQELMPGNDATAYADDEARWSALMAGAQSGDEAGYRQLLTELSAVVNRYVVARFGHQEFVEDCVQEVLLAVHGARHTYDPRRPFRPWLFAIVRHKLVDTLRQGENRRRYHAHCESVPDVPVTGPDSELGSGQLLACLPASLRDALVLTKIGGLTGSEAARHLGISEAALKVRVHRAMGKVRKMLESEGS